MDELEKKAKKGLESFSEKGDIVSVKASLDGFIDDMLGDDVEIITKSKSNMLKWIFIVLAILGLVYIVYQGFQDGSQSKKVETPMALYAQYFEVLPDAMSANERGDNGDNNVESDAILGMKYYNEGQFDKAAPLLMQQNEAGYKLFAAISELKNKSTTSAISLLKESKKIDEANQYTDIIDWYLSLAYLNDNKSDLARKSLTKISNENHYKKDDATEILEKLN